MKQNQVRITHCQHIAARSVWCAPRKKKVCRTDWKRRHREWCFHAPIMDSRMMHTKVKSMCSQVMVDYRYSFQRLSKTFASIFFIFFLLYDLHTKQTTNHQEWGLDRHGEKERARLTVNSIKRLARRQALQYTTIGCWLALLQPRFHPFLISAALLAVCGRSSYCCILVAWPLAKPYPITSFKPGFCCRLKELQNPLLSVV